MLMSAVRQGLKQQNICNILIMSVNLCLLRYQEER